MKIVLVIYVMGIIPAYLCLRHSFIRLSVLEQKNAVDTVLMLISSLFSWITVLVSSTMIGVLSIEDIEAKPTAFDYRYRARRR